MLNNQCILSTEFVTAEHSYGGGDIVCRDVGITYVWDVLSDGTFFCDLFYDDPELDQLYLEALNEHLH